MFNAIILGAGMGTRMKSALSKVMHKIAGVSMFEVVYRTALNFAPGLCTVVASVENKEEIESITQSPAIIQTERLGTGHAVLAALPSLKSAEKTFILYADTPLILADTLQKMTEVKMAEIVVLGFYGKEGEKYGRLIHEKEEVLDIVEYKDATEEQKKINLYNSGIFLVNTEALKQLVPKIQNKNNAKEFYLTDIVKIASSLGLKTKFILTESSEILGVNNREELSIAERIFQERLRKKHMENGVTLVHPESVFFSFDTEIENDVVIEPNVVFGFKVKIKKNCTIKSFSYIEGAEIEEGVSVGPFARIRGKTKIGRKAKIGNFVEVKNSTLKDGVKAGHLAYIGDGEIGANVNIGAGAVFCNYDGKNKHTTVVGENVFIGSNSSLVAPVEIGKNSFIAAGSVITKSVEEGCLAIERGTQKSISRKK